MALLIDAYNCLHAGRARAGAFAELSIRSLCRWIAQAPGRSKTTLVLDGRPKPEEPSENEFPELRLVYSGAGISADKVLLQLLARSTHRKNVTVITDDRALAAAARQLGAQTRSCERFLTTLLTASHLGQHLQAGPPSPSGATPQRPLPTRKTQGLKSPGETEHWLREFDLQPPSTPSPKPKPDDPDDLDMKKLLGF